MLGYPQVVPEKRGTRHGKHECRLTFEVAIIVSVGAALGNSYG